MFYSGMTTLSIEEDEIRLLVLERGKVTKWATAPLPAGLMSEGMTREPAAVGSAIRQLFATQGVSRNKVVTSLTGLGAISRVLTIPQVKPGVLESVVLREAKREMPMPLDEMYLSWRPLGRKENQQEVYALGVPREMVDGQVEALRHAGMRGRAMDLKPLALVRAVNRKNAIITNLENATLDIVIVVEDIPVIVRTISLGKGSSTQEEKWDRLIDELSRTIKYYNDSHREAGLHPGVWVYPSGALTEGPRFRGRLQAAIGRPVVSLRPPLRCPEQLPLARFLVNLGLALKRV